LVLARLFDWRDALVVVQPATMVRWHRAGWRLLWRMKSRAGRSPIPIELRELIRRMARENVLWGEERIANELLLKLGIRISPRTVRKYMPNRPPGRPRGGLRWSTFLKSHARGIRAWSLSGISCVRHSMTTRSIYAEQDEDEECRDSGQVGGAAVDPEGAD
jgi:hypothetical protein